MFPVQTVEWRLLQCRMGLFFYFTLNQPDLWGVYKRSKRGRVPTHPSPALLHQSFTAPVSELTVLRRGSRLSRPWLWPGGSFSSIELK